MRLVDLVQLLAPALWIFAVLMIRAERRVVGMFRMEGATASERAIALPAMRGPRAWQARRLMGAGVLRSVDAESYWLDEVAYSERRRRKRRRALVVAAVLGAAGAAFVLLRS